MICISGFAEGLTGTITGTALSGDDGTTTGVQIAYSVVSAINCSGPFGPIAIPFPFGELFQPWKV